ncbi:MAG TPA: SWIM zinc finger family protein [Anaerolineae bacterium]
MSRYYDYYSHFTAKPAIETDKGIKAKSKQGKFAKNWWANRWITALERLVDAGRLRRGKSYARKGQVLSIEESKSGIAAKVQGSRKTPYKISINVDTLSDAQWEKVIDVLASQAIFAAQLLAGEMPAEIEEAFAEAGVSLFPEKRNELVTDCSCPDYANPCKHVAAVHYILGEQFDEDPFLLFRLRGRTQDQILEALRARRAESAGAQDDEDVEEVATPLADSLAQFWEMGTGLTRFRTGIKPPVTELPILKRLGQPSFLNEDLLKLLGPAYRAITDQGLATAYGTEADDDEEGESDENGS